jgi:hypothetical protein
MELTIISGPASRVLFVNGKAYRPGETFNYPDDEVKDFLKSTNTLWKIEPMVAKMAVEPKNKMLKAEKVKHGTASERPNNPESGEGLSLDFLS